MSVKTTLVDARNPYGQITSAELIIEGPLSELRPFEDGPEGFCAGSEIRDASNRLFAFHIFEENRKKKGGGVQPNMYGLVLSSRDLITYHRLGTYHCKGPIGSRYPAARFERTTVTIV